MRRFWQIAVILVASVVPALTQAAAPKRVLLIHSFGRDFSPWDEFTRSFRGELDRRSPTLVEYYDASLATERFGANQDEVPFLNYLHALFDKRQLDLAVAIGAPAARFVQRYRSQFLPATPVLFAGVDQRRVSLIALDANDTVVATANNFASVAENILRVLPDTTNIFVVSGNSPTEQFWVEHIREEFRPYTDQVQFTWFNDLSFAEILKRAAALPPKSAIFFFSLAVDGAGVAHEGDKAFIRLREAANAPIFSYIDTHFGKGIVGGSLITINDAARRTASVAQRILNGEAPGGIKTEPVEHGIPKFDWRELQRWDISESRLPPGSEVYFRLPGLWQQYRRELIAIFVVVLLQAAVIAWLLFERNRRHRAEMEARSRLVEIVHLNRTAAAGVLSASFSHELNQPLGAILSNTETAEILLTMDPPDVRQIAEILADIRREDQRAAEIIRHVGGLLKKRTRVDLQVFDVNGAVRSALTFIEHEASRRGVALGVSQTQVAMPVRADETHLQQVILNLAFNAMDAMHSCVPSARRMTLETALSKDSEIEVTVTDTGPGIPNDKLKEVFEAFFTTKPDGTGIGLSIARQIIETYGGRIWAGNKPSGGAVFRFTLPMAKA